MQQGRGDSQVNNIYNNHKESEVILNIKQNQETKSSII